MNLKHSPKYIFNMFKIGPVGLDRKTMARKSHLAKRDLKVTSITKMDVHVWYKSKFFIKTFHINHQISLFLLNLFYFYKLCNNFCHWIFKNEVINRYINAQNYVNLKEKKCTDEHILSNCSNHMTLCRSNLLWGQVG